MNYLMFDSECTNGLDDPLCYEVGGAVINENGQVLDTFDYVNADVFCDEELMASAYFIDKVPQYWQDIKSDKCTLTSWYNIRCYVWDLMSKWDITTVIAHNMRFDYSSTVKTQRFLTCSKYRYFFPYGTKFMDTLKMARATFGKQDEYKNFCKEHGYMTGRNSPRMTAEVLYRYLTQNTEFVESHTALDDALIEKDIFAECLRIMPEVDGLLW